jgi:hypothetical protein
VRVLMWPPSAKLPRSAPADYLGCTIRTWRRVHWSDESRLLLRPTDGRARVWRQRNTSFQDNHILGVELS